MPVSLEAAKRRESERRNPAPIPASAYFLTGAEVATYCANAVRGYPPARTLSESERDALAAMLAERIYRRRLGRGSARDVLRYIDRCERFPALMAGSEGIPRGAASREYLRRECASLMRDSREWRDVAETYQTASERDAERGPMIVAGDPYAESDALTASAAREVERTTGEPLPAMPLDSAAVSDAMALALVTDGGPRESVLVALRMAAGVPLATVAVDLGVSLVTAKRRSAAGAKWLREKVPARELVALMREAADALGHVIPADPCAPMLPASAAGAAAAIERAGRTYRASGQTPTTGRVDGASCHPLAFRYVPGESEPSAKRPPRDAAPFPAASAWQARVEALRASGCQWPATVAAAERRVIPTA